MKKATLFVAGVVFMAAFAFVAAAETTGILIDSNCSGRVAADAERLAGHKVSCALSCKDGGFSVVADGKVLKLDAAGNEKALALLEKTGKETQVTVKVAGTVDGDSIKVQEITEVD